MSVNGTSANSGSAQSVLSTWHGFASQSTVTIGPNSELSTKQNASFSTTIAGQTNRNNTEQETIFDSHSSNVTVKPGERSLQHGMLPGQNASNNTYNDTSYILPGQNATNNTDNKISDVLLRQNASNYNISGLLPGQNASNNTDNKTSYILHGQNATNDTDNKNSNILLGQNDGSTSNKIAGTLTGQSSGNNTTGIVLGEKVFNITNINPGQSNSNSSLLGSSKNNSTINVEPPSANKSKPGDYSGGHDYSVPSLVTKEQTTTTTHLNSVNSLVEGVESKVNHSHPDGSVNKIAETFITATTASTTNVSFETSAITVSKIAGTFITATTATTANVSSETSAITVSINAETTVKSENVSIGTSPTTVSTNAVISVNSSSATSIKHDSQAKSDSNGAATSYKPAAGDITPTTLSPKAEADVGIKYETEDNSTNNFRYVNKKGNNFEKKSTCSHYSSLTDLNMFEVNKIGQPHQKMHHIEI
jgi:hypothetical protein